jgi:dihydropyrimidinase
VRGWPVTVVSRGRVAVENNELKVARGSGQFVARGVPEAMTTAQAGTGGNGWLRALVGLDSNKG